MQKVCIVEDDIKLTDEEKEVLKEMLAEKAAE
jgi:GR25 family glycosyltransferase involved in LPS biosynthesis